MPSWLMQEGAVPVLTAQQELQAERQMNEFLRESLADVEAMFRAEDAGWRRMGQEQDQFTAEGRKRIFAYARLMLACDPLIKRGVGLRTAYIHGPGITVTVRDDGAEGQKVDEVYQGFRADPMVEQTFSGTQARIDLERQMGTAGEFFLAFPTDFRTGRVQVRNIDPDQIVQIVRDPEDEATIWYYKRTWTARTVDMVTGQNRDQPRVTYYPALGYWPPLRPQAIGAGEVRWDAPMLHVYDNDPDKSGRGLGDTFAALPWAKANKDFLGRFSVYMEALTGIVAQIKTKSGKAQTAARAAVSAAAGSVVGTDTDTSVEFLSKSGAQIDADSHRPFATMVAAALGVPLTMLLGDPGATGARAVAETLNQPMELEIGLRHQMWDVVERKVADYVIDQAVIAPLGPLRGTVVQDGSRRIVTLPDGDERTLDIDRPPFDSTPLDTLIKAISAADQTEKVPPLVTARLLLTALGVEDIEDILDKLTDDQGVWIGIDQITADAQARQAGRGLGDTTDDSGDEPTD